MPLTVFVDREAKTEVGECPGDAMMRVMDGRWKGTIVWRLVNGRVVDRSAMIRVPLLVVSLLAQCLVLLVASA